MALIGSSNSLGGLAGSNTLARLLVVISGDSSQLTSALAGTQAQLKGFGSQAGALGSALTRTVTLPFLAIGGAAVKAATDFNYALTRVASLTPILDDSGKSFQDLHDDILTLANDPSIVAGPTELADALYFAGSAGLGASQAMDVVKLSAQAMSVGMGDAADISKVLIFAMNNYASEGLTAAAAMDALTVAIREGTAEPEDLAVSLGRLLPVAQQAGVSFQEVTASVAALTNLGVPARVATTSLRALFSQLLAPTIAATKQLDALGISADQLRFKLQQGPIEAFKLLTDATKGNFDQIRTLIPQIRGLTAYYGLSGDALSRYKEIIDHVNNSQGALQRVVSAFMETPTFKFEKAMQQLKIAGISLGDKLIPVFVQLVGIVEDVASGFSALPGPVQAAFAAFLTIGAAVGPLLKLYSVIAQFGTGGVASMKALGVGFLTAATAAVVAVGSFNSLAQGSTNLISIAGTLVGTFLAIKLAISGLSIVAASGALGMGSFQNALAGLTGGPIAAAAVAIGVLVTAFALVVGAERRAEENLTQFRQALIDGARSGQSFQDTLNSIKTTELRDQLAAVAAQLNVLNQPTPIALDRLVPSISGDVVSRFQQLNAAMQDTGQDFGKAGEAILRVNTALQDASNSGGDITQAFLDAGGAGGDLGSALDYLNDASTDPNSGIQGLAGDTKILTADLIAAKDATQAYADQQDAALLGATAQKDAVSNLANQYGVSTDFITQKLGEFGQQAVFTSDQSQNAWAEQAFGMDKFGQRIATDVGETAEAVSKAADEMVDSVTGAFSIFGTVPKDASKAFDVYLERIQATNKAQLDLVANMTTLANRGVPSDLTAQILESEGPGAVAKFADATDKQLKRYVRAFEVNMALGDAEVIKEGIHLQSKAKNNIIGFAKATLSAKGITTKAAQTIVQLMTTAFTNGNLNPAAMGLMQTFLNGLRSAKGLTTKEADQISVAFANELLHGSNYAKDGSLILGQVAQGIAQATGIPIAAVKNAMNGLINTIHNTKSRAVAEGRDIAQGVAAGVRNATKDVQNSGISIMTALANGIRIGTNQAVGAAEQAAISVKNQLDQALHSSPNYASYYMGQKFARQFTEGFNKENLDAHTDLGKLAKGLHNRNNQLGRPSSAHREHRHHDRDRKLKVNISRRRIADELVTDQNYIGW